MTAPFESRASLDWVFGASWVLRGALVLIFVGSGIANLAGLAQLVAEFDHIGLGQWLRFVTAFFQIVGSALLLTRTFALLGEAVLLCVVIGAFSAQLLALHGDLIHVIALLALVLALAWIDRGQLSKILHMQRT